MRLRKILTLCLIQVVIMLCVWQALAAGYQTYMRPTCDCCSTVDHIWNALNVHHYYTQSRHPLWKDVKANTCTLCRKCHLIFHRRNFQKEAPEFCRVFGFDEEKIKLECIKESGSPDGNMKE